MITIFSETHREACLYKSGIMDQNVYDQQIEKYFQFIQDMAKANSIELEIIEQQSTHSFRAETDQEYEFIFYDVPTFWKWIN